MRKKITAVLTILFILSSAAYADESKLFNFFLEAEGGMSKVLLHNFQSGANGTQFDYVTQGGQEILFPYTRVEAGFTLADRHMFRALYQPLVLETEVTFREDVTIDTVTFLADTPMDLKYGFSFWRFTYGFDFFKQDNLNLMAGAAFQLRNASIVFSQKDGAQSTTNQNLGLVPALYVGFEYTFPSGIALGFDATGIYASSAILNGANFEFEGSLLDTSIRVLFPIRENVDTFVNVRFLGGTSDGVSQFEDLYWTKAIEDYGTNNLATLNFSVGLRIK